MLPTSAGVEPATSWSPVGRRIQPVNSICLVLFDQLKASVFYVVWPINSICLVYLTVNGICLVLFDQ